MPEELVDKLKSLVEQLHAHEGPWGEWKGGEKTESGAIQMPYMADIPIVTEALSFLYDNDLIIVFDWSAWQEGRDFFKSEDPNKFDTLDQEIVLKLLTAVARNSRFNEGAWMRLFESGDGQKLFQRLLDLQR